MTNNYKTLQALILQSEGKTLEGELGFGCDYLGKNGDKFRCVKTENDFVWGRLYRNGVLQKTIYKQYKDWSFKILGKDIDLQRILKALGSQCMDMAIDEDGIFLERKPLNVYLSVGIRWNLNHPLHLQSEETITKLTELLK